MRNQLLCTFAYDKNLKKTVDDIILNHNVLYGKVFVLSNVADTKEYICTYNVESESNFNLLDQTISLHRKKQTNTLYTINALNVLIKLVNNNVLDTSYIVEWENYQDTLMTTNTDGLKLTKTKVHDIVYIKEKP
jgi:hypothetical protein